MSGKSRDWGYASSTDDGRLSYTSYEKDGSVNRYTDNGDGGHSHEHWDDIDAYNCGRDADQVRLESNGSLNPSIGEVQDNGGCFLTTACIKYFKENFDDNCYELNTLRWFRDNFVSKEDINHYYKVAPIIVENINKNKNANLIYDYIFEAVVLYCVEQIELGNYEEAYDRYKNTIIFLEAEFGKEHLFKNKVLVK